MLEARAEILTRIRAAHEHAYLPALDEPLERPPAPPPFAEPLADVFCRALLAVQGEVTRVGDGEAARDALLAELEKLGARRVLSWDPEALQLPGLAETLAAAGIQLVPSRLGDPDRRQALAALESIPVGLTAAAAGLARTGSIVLHAHRGQGRLASLLPPIHFALLHVSQLYPDIAAWLAAAGTGQRIAEHSNTVIITGPSRSADIAQTLTLGAHGPRRVHVILVG